MRRKSHPSETPLGKSTRVSGILFDSFLATWSLLVRGFYALGVSWGYGKIREGRRSDLIAVPIPIGTDYRTSPVPVLQVSDYRVNQALGQLPSESRAPPLARDFPSCSKIEPN